MVGVSFTIRLSTGLASESSVLRLTKKGWLVWVWVWVLVLRQSHFEATIIPHPSFSFSPFPFPFPLVSQWQFPKLSHAQRSPEGFVIKLRSWVWGSEFLVSFPTACPCPCHIPSWKSSEIMLVAVNNPGVGCPTWGSLMQLTKNRTSPWESQ